MSATLHDYIHLCNKEYQTIALRKQIKLLLYLMIAKLLQNAPVWFDISLDLLKKSKVGFDMGFMTFDWEDGCLLWLALLFLV